jgi:hypothetical protein
MLATTNAMVWPFCFHFQSFAWFPPPEACNFLYLGVQLSEQFLIFRKSSGPGLTGVPSSCPTLGIVFDQSVPADTSRGGMLWAYYRLSSSWGCPMAARQFCVRVLRAPRCTRLRAQCHVRACARMRASNAALKAMRFRH